MLKRFLLAFAYFVGLIVRAPSYWLCSPRRPVPQPIEPPGCERNLATVAANVASLQARVKTLKAGTEICHRHKAVFSRIDQGARGHTALCRPASIATANFGRLDADVEHNQMRQSPRAAVNRRSQAALHTFAPVP